VAPIRLTWSLTPHSPAAGLATVHAFTTPRLRTAIVAIGQDLLLSRTMLTGILPGYVGRFACGWHRLSTTDPDGFLYYIIIVYWKQVFQSVYFLLSIKLPYGLLSKFRYPLSPLLPSFIFLRSASALSIAFSSL
jgi:hypothetical protein